MKCDKVSETKTETNKIQNLATELFLDWFSAPPTYLPSLQCSRSETTIKIIQKIYMHPREKSSTLECLSSYHWPVNTNHYLRVEVFWLINSWIHPSFLCAWVWWFQLWFASTISAILIKVFYISSMYTSVYPLQ